MKPAMAVFLACLLSAFVLQAAEDLPRSKRVIPWKSVVPEKGIPGDDDDGNRRLQVLALRGDWKLAANEAQLQLERLEKVHAPTSWRVRRQQLLCDYLKDLSTTTDETRKKISEYWKLREQADLFLSRGQHERALTAAQLSFDIVEKLGDPYQLLAVEARHWVATGFAATGDYEQSANELEASAAFACRQMGLDSPDYATAMVRLAHVRHLGGEREVAENIAETAIQLVEQGLNESREFWTCGEDLFDYLKAARKFEMADAFGKRLLAKVDGDSAADRALLQLKWAQTLVRREDAKQAEKPATDALEYYKQQKASSFDGNEQYLKSLVVQIQIAELKGDDKAYETHLADFAKAFRTTVEDLSAPIKDTHREANKKFDLNRIEHLKHLLEVLGHAKGEFYWDICAFLANEYLNGPGYNYYRALATLEAVRVSVEGEQGHDSPRYARTLANLAAVHGRLGDLNRARELTTEALTLTQQQEGPNSFPCGEITLNLALVERDAKNDPKAEEVLTAALKILRDAPEDPLLKAADCLAELAAVRLRAKDKVKAAALLEECELRFRTPKDRLQLAPTSTSALSWNYSRAITTTP